MTLPYAEPYKIKMTEAIRTSTRAEREAWIREARYNLFTLRSDQVTIDLLTDSGTGSMSDRQWAAMMTGDESYAGCLVFLPAQGDDRKHLRDATMSCPTHQGRAAENVIFSVTAQGGRHRPGQLPFRHDQRAHRDSATLPRRRTARSTMRPDAQIEVAVQG